MKYVEKFDMFQTGDDIFVRDIEAHSSIEAIKQDIVEIEEKVANNENNLLVLNERKNERQH